jgi:DNA polymerase elongation subunit (family B)
MKIAELEFIRDGSRIVTFTRDKSNKLVRKEHDFKHYIYEADPKGTYTSLYGVKARRKYFPRFWDAKPYIKESTKDLYEGDLPYIKRFIIDHFDDLKSEGEPRILFYDIETTGFSSEYMEIISIVAYDTYDQKYYEFLWKPGEEGCNSERKMLVAFAKMIQKVDPDILTGWNSDRFDLPFIIDRMNILNLNTSLLSRMNQDVSSYHSGNEGEVYQVKGRVNIDYLKAYKKMHNGEMENYRLETVAQHELGVGKIETGELPGTLWEQGKDDELLRYNRRDVEIMVELDQKLRIFEFLDRVSDIASCSLEDTLYNSRIVDSYILKYTSKRRIVLPSRRFTNKRRGYTGAKVLEPVVGIHENTGIYDLASLYPSIIITWNLSPETVNEAEPWNEPEGLVPILLKGLFELRQEYRNQGRDNDQRVVKEIMNSFYGVMALPTFRLYEAKVASETTKQGRKIIEYTKEVAENEGYKVIYGDTDSVFVSGIPNISSANKLESIINKHYDSYARNIGLPNHRLRIEFEGYASKTLMVAKKRYAMKLEDGSYKIAGFQMKRSDAPALAKEIQENIISMILEGASKKEAYKYYDQMKEEVKQGNQNEKIGLPRAFSKALDKYANNYAVDGAKYSNKHLDKNIGAGDKCIIYHIKRSRSDLPDTKSIAIEAGESIPFGFIVDTSKHWTRINKAVDKLLGDFIPKDKQQSLADFI